MCSYAPDVTLPLLLPELVPTNTTITAAYVAVETRVSTLDTLTPNEISSAKIITATDTVMRLLVSEGLIVMIIIGTTRKGPPVGKIGYDTRRISLLVLFRPCQAFLVGKGQTGGEVSHQRLADGVRRCDRGVAAFVLEIRIMRGPRII